MSLNVVKILAPKMQAVEQAAIVNIHVEKAQRVKKNAPLITIHFQDQNIVLASPSAGRVNRIFVHAGQTVPSRALLAIIETFEVPDYRPSEDEVNPNTELGEGGRRGVERKGEKEFGKGFSRELFDAPTEKHGQGSGLKQNPLTQNMKEGVPPKMNASASQNQPAVEDLVENASQDPELQKQLSNQLQQQLQIQQAPSSAPTNTAR